MKEKVIPFFFLYTKNQVHFLVEPKAKIVKAINCNSVSFVPDVHRNEKLILKMLKKASYFFILRDIINLKY